MSLKAPCKKIRTWRKVLRSPIRHVKLKWIQVQHFAACRVTLSTGTVAEAPQISDPVSSALPQVTLNKTKKQTHARINLTTKCH